VKDPSQFDPNLSLTMWTSNARGSGLEMFNHGDKFQLQVLPKFEMRNFSPIHYEPTPHKSVDYRAFR
jgi:hypothetical protein